MILLMFNPFMSVASKREYVHDIPMTRAIFLKFHFFLGGGGGGGDGERRGYEKCELNQPLNFTQIFCESMLISMLFSNVLWIQTNCGGTDFFTGFL